LIDFSVIITQYITYSIELFEGAQPQSHPNSKCACSPLWMAMHQQCLIFSGVYNIISHKSVITTNTGMHRKRRGGDQSTAIGLSTATSSSEFKQCIQPIVVGHAPTIANIQWGSIGLFYISQVYCTTNAGMHCKRCDRTAIKFEHSHNVIRIQNVHPAHYGWPCTNNG